jgi:hypothetical protein
MTPNNPMGVLSQKSYNVQNDTVQPNPHQLPSSCKPNEGKYAGYSTTNSRLPQWLMSRFTCMLCQPSLMAFSQATTIMPLVVLQVAAVRNDAQDH